MLWLGPCRCINVFDSKHLNKRKVVVPASMQGFASTVSRAVANEDFQVQEFAVDREAAVLPI